MASHIFLSCLFSLLALTHALASDTMYPFNCSAAIDSCNAFLYHIDKGLQLEQVASFYNVSSNHVSPIRHGDRLDYLVSVPASCKTINGTTAYFYDVPYTVRQNDTFYSVSDEIYSGQAWKVGGEENQFVVGNVVAMHLLSGCVDSNSEIVGTYTVQQNDTISDIANRLSSNVDGIESMNSLLIQDPNFLAAGWVLFVPMELTIAPSPTLPPTLPPM